MWIPHELQRSKSDTFYEFYNYAFKEKNTGQTNPSITFILQICLYELNTRRSSFTVYL